VQEVVQRIEIIGKCFYITSMCRVYLFASSTSHLILVNISYKNLINNQSSLKKSH